MKTVLVIPAEGDSVETMQWYIKKLCGFHGDKIRVLVFDNKVVPDRNWRNLGEIMQQKVETFAYGYFKKDTKVEIHAQGGFGAYVAYLFMSSYSSLISSVFFVGGAPSPAMTPIAKFFHKFFVKIWYYAPIPFFADDPNPMNDPDIRRIKQSSTKFMRENALLYRNQLLWIGHWTLPEKWRALCPAYFVPNGDTVRPKWWDNTYSEEKAMLIWKNHWVGATEKPGNYFSFYSMMPAEELFAVMQKTT